MATYDDFIKLDIRVGKIVSAEHFPEARKPSYKIRIDFGAEIGVKSSSVQLVKHYPDKEKLIGRQVICIVNFPPRQIGPYFSEVLTLGVPDFDKECILLQPDKEVPLGGRMY